MAAIMGEAYSSSGTSALPKGRRSTPVRTGSLTPEALCSAAAGENAPGPRAHHGGGPEAVPHREAVPREGHADGGDLENAGGDLPGGAGGPGFALKVLVGPGTAQFDRGFREQNGQELLLEKDLNRLLDRLTMAMNWSWETSQRMLECRTAEDLYELMAAELSKGDQIS